MEALPYHCQEGLSGQKPVQILLVQCNSVSPENGKKQSTLVCMKINSVVEALQQTLNAL